jgi:hypothetical protein
MFRRNFLAFIGSLFGGTAIAAPIPKGAAEVQLGKWIIVGTKTFTADHGPQFGQTVFTNKCWVLRTDGGESRPQFIGCLYLDSTAHTSLRDLKADNFEDAKKEWLRECDLFLR